MTPDLSYGLGLRFVHQDLGMFDRLSVAENVALGSRYQTGPVRRIRWAALHARTQRLIDSYHIDASPSTPVRALRPSSRTLLAIARALDDEQQSAAPTLILDEPTAALPEQEVEQLLASLRRFAEQGQTIMYISHHLDEVLDLADDVTVLRDGVVAASRPVSGLAEKDLVQVICGRELVPHPLATPEQPRAGQQVPALEVTGVVAGPLRGVSLKAHRGELLGIAGLVGSGRSTLLRTLFGVQVADAGAIRFGGRDVSLCPPKKAMRHGVAYVPEDRLRDAAFGTMSLRENLVVASISQFFIRLRMAIDEEKTETRRQIARFDVRASSSEQAFQSLSGGNQQKLVVARWLRRDPWLILLDEPTQGVDVGARRDIYEALRRSAVGGATVVIAASDLTELAEHCDRVLVLRGGCFVAERRAPAIDADELVHLANFSAPPEPQEVA
jgi:ribose transport system ATP-binding protein